MIVIIFVIVNPLGVRLGSRFKRKVRPQIIFTGEALSIMGDGNYQFACFNSEK